MKSRKIVLFAKICGLYTSFEDANSSILFIIKKMINK